MPRQANPGSTMEDVRAGQLSYILRWRNSWGTLLAINVAVVVGVFIHKILLPPYVPYIHLLIDYRFGFIKRALIGAIVSLFAAKVPVWLVFALGGAIWLVALVLFVELFRRTFGFERATLPLFVFMAGSPFFLKNFMHSLGHFDIYGCALAIVLFLIPSGSILYVALAALFSVVLILIHHIHFLMYVPTIVVIVGSRIIFRIAFAGPRSRSGLPRLLRSPRYSLQRNSGVPCRCRKRISSISEGTDVRSIPHGSLAIQLHLVSAAYLAPRGAHRDAAGGVMSMSSHISLISPSRRPAKRISAQQRDPQRQREHQIAHAKDLDVLALRGGHPRGSQGGRSRSLPAPTTRAACGRAARSPAAAGPCSQSSEWPSPGQPSRRSDPAHACSRSCPGGWCRPGAAGGEPGSHPRTWRWCWARRTACCGCGSCASASRRAAGLPPPEVSAPGFR